MSIDHLRTPLDALVSRQLNQPIHTCLDRSLIEQFQLDQLRKTISHAAENSPYYRRTLGQKQVTRLHQLPDIAHLPLLTEQDIRDCGQQMICVSQDEIARIITMQSSGTTGAPKRLFFTREDLEHTLQFFYWGMQAMVRPGQQVAILLPGQTPDSTGELLSRALRGLDVESNIIGLISDPAQGARRLAEIDPDVLVGFPVQLLAIARCAAYHNLNLSGISSILLCSDYIADSICLELKNQWECGIFSHYGTVETGLGGAVDCQSHQGCHIREADLLLEIIHPKTLEPVEQGQYGEIVITTLSRVGMPLIRYRTGDSGRLIPGQCPCGSHIQRLDRVQGRIDSDLSLDDGNIINMQQLDELLFPLQGLLDISAELHRNNTKETLDLHLVTLPGSERETVYQAEQCLQNSLPFRSLHTSIHISRDLHIHPAKRIIYDRRQDSV
ncbi:DVU_1553 family AMP-dependent CoA ligase [Desulfogranum japonicum]|uniref:DVU_1553 family AMP-dependent CoA ligase n=1 Tax=Desulfogranum japonicum TaxID=231447 RepID=UPI00041383AC|nr:AMP-binding protein [Desulfogranum japonicum]